MDPSYLRRIKQLGIIAMFSDDILMEQLVLKGGNLLDLVYQISTRPSADLDFSIDGDFADIQEAERRIAQALTITFASESLIVFDIKFRSTPPRLTPDRADFWGGYKVEFKLIEREKYHKLDGNLERIQKAALTVGKVKSGSSASTKFNIDLSRYEYCKGKHTSTIDGYNIHVYSPAMFVCEKIRAICQQMPEYIAFVQSHQRGRARDFLDIFTILAHFPLDFENESFRDLISKVFESKRVPLKLINRIGEQREVHRDSFQAVRDTVKPGVDLKEYDYYFNYVCERCNLLKSLGNE